MWIVRLALRRPYTFVVLALLIGVLGIVSIATMTVDIFPAIDIPVVTVIWNYSGLSPTEMQDRIVTVSERAFTTTVNGIEHIESVSLRGVAVTRLYFHPAVPIEAAIAQVNAQAQQIVRVLGRGLTNLGTWEAEPQRVAELIQEHRDAVIDFRLGWRWIRSRGHLRLTPLDDLFAVDRNEFMKHGYALPCRIAAPITRDESGRQLARRRPGDPRSGGAGHGNKSESHERQSQGGADWRPTGAIALGSTWFRLQNGYMRF